MPPTKTTPSDADARLERELAGLKAEYERLREDKVRAEQDLANVRNQLRELEESAQAAYGTADPEALERLLAAMRAENERLIAAYREHIAAVRADLDAVERDFAG